jgi:hypothetical protein
MEHIAIDLGGRESPICVMSADGKILNEVPVTFHDGCSPTEIGVKNFPSGPELRAERG